MRIAQIKRVLPILLKHNIVPFIWGRQGVGKTQSVRQLAADMSVGFVPLYLGTQADMGDILGLLKHNADGSVSHARPEWMPTVEAVAAGQFPEKGIIFLDEFNRAHPDVLQGMFSFLLDGTIHNHKLAPGWSKVAAGNYQNNNFTVTDMSDSALNSRFCHLDFKPTAEEFVVFLESQGKHVMADFVRHHPNMIGEDSKQCIDLNMIKPDNRALFSQVAALQDEDLGDVEFEVYAGCVGAATAGAYVAHKKNAEKAVSINDILERYPKVRDEVRKLSKSGKETSARFDLLATATTELMAKLEADKELLTTGDKLENLKQFLLDVPVELAMKVFEDMKKQQFANKNAILNDTVFVDKFANKAAQIPKSKKVG